MKLCDFGNARVVSLASVTGASLTWGTPEYVGSEVFTRGRANPRSDSLFARRRAVRDADWAASLVADGDADAARGRRRQARPVSADGARPGCRRAAGRPAVSLTPGSSASGEEAFAFRRVERASRPPCERPAPPVASPGPTMCRAVSRVAPKVLRLRHAPKGGWRLVLRKLDDDARLDGESCCACTRSRNPCPCPCISSPEIPAFTPRPKLGSGSRSGRAVQRARREHGTFARRVFRRNGLDTRPLQGATDVTVADLDWQARFRRACRDRLRAVGLPVCARVAALADRRRHWRGGDRLDTRNVVLRAGRALRRRGGNSPAARSAGSAARGGSAAGRDDGGGRALRAPEARALVAEAASEIYRLGWRAEMLGGAGAPPSAANLFARMTTAAPALWRDCRRSRRVWTIWTPRSRETAKVRSCRSWGVSSAPRRRPARIATRSSPPAAISRPRSSAATRRSRSGRGCRRSCATCSAGCRPARGVDAVAGRAGGACGRDGRGRAGRVPGRRNAALAS